MIPMIIPKIEERFNFKLKDIISRLNPIGPVKLAMITFAPGMNFAINDPNAEPNIAPIKMKAMK